MSTTPTEQQVLRERILAILWQVVGYEMDPSVEELTDLDSLQVLELLVSLEEEFDVDAESIIESGLDWWTSLSGLVEAVTTLIAQAGAKAEQRG